MCLAYPVLVLSTEVSQSYQVSIWERSDPSLTPAEVSTCFPVQRDRKAAAGPYVLLKGSVAERNASRWRERGKDEGEGMVQNHRLIFIKGHCC